MLIKVNKENTQGNVFNISFGSEEPEVVVKKFVGSAERARLAAAEAAAIAAGIYGFMELQGGYSSDNNKPEDNAKNYYDQKYIDELTTLIKTYETNILNLSNLINQEHSEAENAVKNRDTKNLDLNNNLAEENLKKMKDLNIELKKLREKLEAAKKLPLLSAERARIAAEEAAEILNSAKKIDTSTIITGGYVESVDIEINNLQNEINNLKKKILNLNNKTSQEYSQAKNNIVVKNKLELEYEECVNNELYNIYNKKYNKDKVKNEDEENNEEDKKETKK
jgi:hypothetical protein